MGPSKMEESERLFEEGQRLIRKGRKLIEKSQIILNTGYTTYYSKKLLRNK